MANGQLNRVSAPWPMSQQTHENAAKAASAKKSQVIIASQAPEFIRRLACVVVDESNDGTGNMSKRASWVKRVGVAVAVVVGASTAWSVEASQDAPRALAAPKDAVSGDGADTQAALDMLQTQCTSNLTNPNPGDPLPGAWANPKHYGIGWTFAFDSQTRRMMVVWHTFYPQVGGGQTWLISDWADVLPGPNGTRTWTAALFRTRYNDFGGRNVGSVTLAFPADSATRASAEWHWSDPANRPGGGDGINVSGSECIYSFGIDGPASQGPSLAAPQPPPSPSPSAGESGPFYVGIWFDKSTPGFALEVAQGQTSQYFELQTMDIYDTDRRPVWVWSEMTNVADWPSPMWTRNDVGYRTAKYNMATTEECSTKELCVDETRWGEVAPYASKPYGRQYHDADKAVVALKLNTTSPVSLAWPPTDWPPIPPGSNVSGCDFAGDACRPIYKHTDNETLTVYPLVCDVTSAGTCKVHLNWTASPLAIIERINPITGQRLPHGSDQGIVGGGIIGDNVEDTLTGDEQVIYRLTVGDRLVVNRGARAALSTISATRPCVIPAIPAGQTTCVTTVTWWTPDAQPGNFVYVDRYAQVGAGTPTQTLIASQLAYGTKTDTIQRGTKVWYKVRRLADNTHVGGTLASTESTPTIPVDASITAAPNQCSIALNQTSCTIALNWVAGPTDQVYRVLDNGTAVLVTTCSASPCTDSLPPDSHVRYAVKNTAGAELARSADVSAFASRLTGVLIQNSSTIAVDWSSVPGSVIDRVTETASNTRTRLPADYAAGFGHYVDAPAAGARVHYELTIASVLHATTAAVHVPVAPPTLTSFTPPSGAPGTVVRLIGTGFSSSAAANVVKFNGTVATVIATTSATLDTTVPAGATTGPISVTVSGQTGTSSTSFVVLSVPPLPPTAVTVPGASASAGFTVTWTPSAAPPVATSFKLQRASSPSGPWTVINVALPATPASYAVTVPTSGTYYYQVAGCIGASCSAYTTSAGIHVTLANVVGETFYFHHTNLQGSVVATSDAQGNIVAASHFRSFGSRLDRAVGGSTGPGNTPMNHLGFTGKWHDDELQLDYFGARHYDAATGRFISIDPAGFSEGNLQSFNRYAYANNNPYKYIDPDGREIGLAYHAQWQMAGGYVVPTSPNDWLAKPLAGSVLALMAPVAGVAAFEVGMANPATATTIFNTILEAGAGDALGGSSLVVGGAAAAGLGALEDASNAAYKAASRVGEFSIPLKHLPDAGGRWAKFAEGTNPNALIEEALSSSSAKFSPNKIEGSYKVTTDLDRVIGTNDESSLRVIFGQDGNIWTAFPVK